jgi:hypothetical protein
MQTNRTTMEKEKTKLSRQGAFQILEGWKRLVQIEQHPKIYRHTITALSPDSGTVTFSARVDGEQKPLVFHWADAAFEWFPSHDPGAEWEETLLVFPPSGELITLRRFRVTNAR